MLQNRKPTVRPYRTSDKGALLELLRLNTPAFFAPSEEADYLDYLDKEADHYFVVEEAGTIVGCGGFNLQNNGRRAHISWDLFHPEAHGKGHGTELTRYRITEIQKLPGVEQIVVRTSQMTFLFYQKLGFELKEVVKDYWAEGFDLYWMELGK